MSDIPGRAIDALKGYPLLLGLLILNAIFVGLVAWSVNQNNQRHAEQIQRLIEYCATAR